MENQSTRNLFNSVVFLCAPITAALSVFAEEPRPTPTPRAGTLAAFAATTSLDRSSVRNETGPIVVTTDNLADLGMAGGVTHVQDPIAPPPEVDLSRAPSAMTRAHWRKKVMAQSRVVAKLEGRSDGVEAEIDRLERGRLDSRTLDKIEKAEAKLKTIEAEIRREEQALSRIIGDARKEGAQPGWFR